MVAVLSTVCLSMVCRVRLRLCCIFEKIDRIGMGQHILICEITRFTQKSEENG
jgi:hypothetical protein